MMVLKYSCPQCRRSMECEESKSLDEDVCGHCGCVFIPASRPNVKFCEAKNTMPPLPVEVAPPPRRSTKLQKVRSAPPRRTNKKVTVTAKDIVVARPTKSDRIRQQGSYLNVVLLTLALYMPWHLFIAINSTSDDRGVLAFLMFIFCFPTLLISFIAYCKGRKFWMWWLSSWFLPGFVVGFLSAFLFGSVGFIDATVSVLSIQLIILIGVCVVESLSICGECRMRIPRRSKICHYCGK